MSGIKPNFDDWRKLSSIEIWEIACLMQGFDPRALADVGVRDRDYPTSPYCVSPDTSWEEKLLISSVLTHHLSSAPVNITEPTSDTRVSVVSLVPWLRLHGHHDLATELDSPAHSASPAQMTVTPPIEVSDPERRLTALRVLGGEAKWKLFRGSQQWTFTKISELTAQEAHSGRKRRDMKTIRKDLCDAAEAESMAKKKAELLND